MQPYPASITSEITAGNIAYVIKNGVCFVRMAAIVFRSIGTGLTIATGLPKPAIGMHISLLDSFSGDVMAGLWIDAGYTILQAHVIKLKGSNGAWLTFSYPIAP